MLTGLVLLLQLLPLLPLRKVYWPERVLEVIALLYYTYRARTGNKRTDEKIMNASTKFGNAR